MFTILVYSQYSCNSLRVGVRGENLSLCWFWIQGSLVGRLLSPEAASLLLLEHQVVRLILKTSGSLAPIYTL